MTSGGSLRAVVGMVKWFDPRKGFGFLVGPEGQDIFVHYSVIEGDGFRVLDDQSRVEYDATRSDRGWKATRVVRVASETQAPPAGQTEASELDHFGLPPVRPVRPPQVTVPGRTGYARSPRRGS